MHLQVWCTQNIASLQLTFAFAFASLLYTTHPQSLGKVSTPDVLSTLSGSQTAAKTELRNCVEVAVLGSRPQQSLWTLWT